MAEIRFPSIANDQIGYLFDTMAYSAHAQAVRVDGDMQQFDTGGDGMCQHSPGYPIPSANFIDFMYSLAAYMAHQPEVLSTIGYKLHNHRSDRDFEFAASLKYKPDSKKPQYYSIEDRKVSGSDSKRHDRRYEEVTTWMDGSFEAIVRLLTKNFDNPFERFKVRYELAEWFSRTQQYGAPPGALALKWTDDWSEARRFDSAFRTTRNAVEAIDAMERAKRGIENYRHNLERARGEAEPKAAEVAAE